MCQKNLHDTMPFAAMKSFFQTLSSELQDRRGLQIFCLAAVFSVLLRLVVSCFGNNFDYESYKIVASLMEQDKIVYSNTERYNYGPIWFYILYGIKWCFGSYFRYGIILFLSLCDIGIGSVLWKLQHRIAALFYLLSPLVIYTSGYHNQFDNFAIVVTLFAVFIMQKYSSRHIALSKLFYCSCLLGISLVIKHIFVFFVFWLFFYYKGASRKIIVLFVPLMIFGCSFLPFVFSELVKSGTCNEFIAVGRAVISGDKNKVEYLLNEKIYPGRPVCKGIGQNILFYKSYNDKIFHTWCLPEFLQKLIPAEILFFGGILLIGFLMRNSDLLKNFFYYTAFLLILSTALANQYLVIPGAFMAVYAFPAGIFYHCLGVLMLISRDTYMGGVYLMAVLLLLLTIVCIERNKIANWIQRIVNWGNSTLPY